jgi:hypothetical protein
MASENSCLILTANPAIRLKQRSRQCQGRFQKVPQSMPAPVTALLEPVIPAQEIAPASDDHLGEIAKVE